jgi:hypothetical protein
LSYRFLFVIISFNNTTAKGVPMVGKATIVVGGVRFSVGGVGKWI